MYARLDIATHTELVASEKPFLMHSEGSLAGQRDYSEGEIVRNYREWALLRKNEEMGVAGSSSCADRVPSRSGHETKLRFARELQPWQSRVKVQEKRES